ncbi:peptidase M20A [Actinomyces sp. Chiba101]|uniref:TadE/TadG family type IV pilus assembly protein n=1 Tax=Actinomyces TaxID=1654 RepID=UPI000974E16C|nr:MULTISPECIES: TadE/TadG family type IV pilus assembly protein [Actinomyces]BAW94117.1 peptidase M20A [Actinomyces sp. Chiba101]GAV95323.1 peptidase M20A family [Actinomyces denticolens]SUU13764.1 TadE-like protein [Actinomyces denticolens]
MRSRPCRLSEEIGASTVELLAFFPLLMAIILLTVQVSFNWYGQEVATTAAREAARIVRTGGGSAESIAQARQTTPDYARNVGGQALEDVAVSIQVNGEEVEVTVSGRPRDVFAGLSPDVSATVSSPIEEFRSDQ